VILKEKEFTNPSDPRLRAGEEAEKQMAFYLQRAFRKRDDCFVINDLRVVHDGDIAQIDHLVVSIYGLFIVESKSIHGTISINQHGDWQRAYNDEISGMPSPVLQAQEQGRILKELLRANAEKVLGKMLFGKVQKGFGYCPVSIYVAISDSGIIERGMDVPELFKADVVAGVITKKLTQLKSKANLLSPKNFLSTDIVWAMTEQEAKAAAEFLVSEHTPSDRSVKSEPAIAKPKPTSTQQPEKPFVPRVGATCPECGQQKLVRKSINRSDGTETDFLACQGYPGACKALFPLVAVVSKPAPKIKAITTPKFEEGAPCPKCGSGTLTRRKGVKGRTDFWACANYRKTKCDFAKPIA
jgi:ssDNA-binding Zn-finger/Zn-ribbon topoisomerase 1